MDESLKGFLDGIALKKMKETKMKDAQEAKIKDIAESGMDKQDIMAIWESKEIYAKVLIRRKIREYADAYGEDFTKEYARKRCESDAIVTIMTSAPYAKCPDWFGDYFDARYSEEISQG